MKKKNKSLGEAIAIGSAIAGAALGAAAVLLSDKKNQDKIKKTIDNVSKEASEIRINVKRKIDEITNNKKAEKIKVVKKAVKKPLSKPSGKVYTPKT